MALALYRRLSKPMFAQTSITSVAKTLRGAGAGEQNIENALKPLKRNITHMQQQVDALGSQMGGVDAKLDEISKQLRIMGEKMARSSTRPARRRIVAPAAAPEDPERQELREATTLGASPTRSTPFDACEA